MFNLCREILGYELTCLCIDWFSKKQPPMHLCIGTTYEWAAAAGAPPPNGPTAHSINATMQANTCLTRERVL